MNLKYNSPATTKSKKRKTEISQLAQDSFAAFEPFINTWDCGVNGGGNPVHVITKADLDLFNRHQAGERGLVDADGEQFRPYQNVLCKIYSAKHAHDHIFDRKTSYYTSGKNGLALIYLDVDAHHPWQTDEYRAKAVLQEVYSFGYYRASYRGQNGYLKVRYTSIAEFNRIANYVQGVLKRYFLHLGILSDIEIKGTITDRNRSGSLAKLPFANKDHCDMRDETDSWNYPQLEKFKACPIVNARYILGIARRLEKRLDDEKIKQFAEYKRVLMEAEKKAEEEKKAAERQKAAKPSKLLVQVLPKQQATPPVPPRHASIERIRLNLPASADADAFARNRKDIPPFVRVFYRENCRMPTTDEALYWLKANGRYSGQWSDNEAHRARRVGQILRFTEEGFDPKKLSNGKHNAVDLKVGKFLWWVRQKYGKAMDATYTDDRQFDPVSMTAPVKDIAVPARFVATFLAAADFCLRRDPLANKAVPTNRIKKIWKMVEGGARWNQRYFQTVRDSLNRIGVVRIFDKKHRSGKAWRWEAGPNFPEDSIGEMHRKLREQCQRPKGEAVSLEEFLAGTNNLTNLRLHNTLYNDGGLIFGFSDDNLPVRAPP